MRLLILVEEEDDDDDVVVAAAMAAPRAISRISHANIGHDVDELFVVIVPVDDDLELDIPALVPAISTGPLAATHLIAPPGR